MDIKVKRAYDPAGSEDGQRVLVDRIWPRGISKDKARIDWWPKDIAPSKELRKWFGHDPDRWGEFQNRYVQELQDQGELIQELLDMARNSRVTLVFGSKEERYNNAVALKAYLESLDRE
jgi:uncharacterized protein YeaO (DUF488 family)